MSVLKFASSLVGLLLEFMCEFLEEMGHAESGEDNITPLPFRFGYQHQYWTFDNDCNDGW